MVILIKSNFNGMFYVKMVQEKVRQGNWKETLEQLIQRVLLYKAEQRDGADPGQGWVTAK